MLILAVLLTVGLLAGCEPARDPAKWYLTGYENRKFLFEHDHKRYTAECMASFSGTSRQPDTVSDCTFILDAPGIG
jgi:hypothetical protein